MSRKNLKKPLLLLGGLTAGALIVNAFVQSCCSNKQRLWFKWKLHLKPGLSDNQKDQIIEDIRVFIKNYVTERKLPSVFLMDIEHAVFPSNMIEISAFVKEPISSIGIKVPMPPLPNPFEPFNLLPFVLENVTFMKEESINYQ